MKRYIVKVELDQATPSVWRKFIVPAHISLDRLHDVLQIVLGWVDYHLVSISWSDHALPCH